MTKRPDPLAVTPAQLARAQRWPIGTAVTLTPDDGGGPIAAQTYGAPWRHRGTWMILLRDGDVVLGGCPLARITERSG